MTTLTSTALCPADRQEVEEVECTCLPRRIVEDDLTSGLSPLGLDSEQCVQVPSDLVYNLHNLNGLSCHAVERIISSFSISGPA